MSPMTLYFQMIIRLHINEQGFTVFIIFHSKKRFCAYDFLVLAP